MSLKLDENKPHGVAFIGDHTYIGQDGKYFDPNTKEEVTPPKPVQTGFACKFCGALRPTAETLKEHLLAVHSNKVPDLQPHEGGSASPGPLGFGPQPIPPASLQDTVPVSNPVEPEPEGEPEPGKDVKVDPLSGLGTKTVPELKVLAKGAGVKGFNNMDKTALIDALTKLPKTGE